MRAILYTARQTFFVNRKDRAYQLHSKQKSWRSNREQPVQPDRISANKHGLERWAEQGGNAEEFGVETWLADLREAALKELVHHAGVGNGNYERLSGRVSIARLQDAWGMLSEWRVPKRFFLQYTVNSLRDHRLTLGVDFAMMAALSHALECGKLDLHSLHLEVIEAHMSDHAGAIAGLIMVVKALPATDVRDLTISLVYKGTNVQLHSVDSVKAAILESLGRVSSLTNVDWKFVDTDGGQKAVAFETEMQLAKARTEIAAKTSLLLAGHHRMQERCRLLGKMPRDLLSEIFRRAFGPIKNPATRKLLDQHSV